MAVWWDENWQTAVGWLIGVLGILAAVVAVWWQRQPKRLDYRIIRKVPILSSSTHDLGGQFTVNYRGMHVADPYVLTVRIMNTGKRAIKTEDYEEPIRISYIGSTMLDSFVSDSSNVYVKPGTVHHDEETSVVDIRPGLLNRKEWLDVQLFTDGRPEGIKVVSRFADQTRPMKEVDRERRRLPTPILATGVGLIGLGLGLLYNPNSGMEDETARNFGMFTLTILLAIVVATFVSQLATQRRAR